MAIKKIEKVLKRVDKWNNSILICSHWAGKVVLVHSHTYIQIIST